MDLKSLGSDPTYGDKILDVLITNAHSYYDKATVLPPIKPDSDLHGAPSDHKVVRAGPIANPAARVGLGRVVTRKRQKFTETALAGLSKFLGVFDWSQLYHAADVNQMLEIIESTIKLASEFFCPVEYVRVKLNQDFYVSTKLAKLCKEKSLEHKRHGYSRKKGGK